MSAESQIVALQSEPGTPPDQPAGIAEIISEEKPRIPEELSILPVRGFVAFPGTILPLTVSRPESIKLLDDTLPRTKVLGLLTQRDELKENPEPAGFVQRWHRRHGLENDAPIR